jgi:hypothetical protein
MFQMKCVAAVEMHTSFCDTPIFFFQAAVFEKMAGCEATFFSNKC